MTRPRLRQATVALLTAASAAGCGEPFTQPVVLGGEAVPASVLNHGREAYVRNCYACHGMKGDGKGPSSPGLKPPPRDFTLGIIKFAAVPSADLPRDADYIRIVGNGLHGTAMLAWDVPRKDLFAIIQYIKTFSDRWKDPDARAGERIDSSPDPYGEARRAEAVERGKRLYHVTARCSSCHANFVTRAEFAAMTKELTGTDVTEFREDFHASVLKDSDWGVKFLPTDFLVAEVRSGSTPDDLYRTVASGVGGTAMPTWKGVLPEEDLWAMVYYVKSLADARDTPAGRALKQKLASDPPSPAPEPSKGGT